MMNAILRRGTSALMRNVPRTAAPAIRDTPIGQGIFRAVPNSHLIFPSLSASKFSDLRSFSASAVNGKLSDALKDELTYEKETYEIPEVRVNVIWLLLLLILALYS